MGDTRNNLQGVKPHKDYYLNGGDLHIIAEDREFRVHRYFFERESSKFRLLLSSPSPGQPQQGSSHLTAIKLQDGVSARDFERFLWVFYNPSYSLYDSTVADWSRILHLAHDWQFEQVVKLAIRELEKMEMSTVDRIALYQEHGVSKDAAELVAHYAALCTRGYPLDLDESKKLGLETVVLINQTTHALPKPEGDGSASPVDSSNAAMIAKIIAHVGAGKQSAATGSHRVGPVNGAGRRLFGSPEGSGSGGVNLKPGSRV